MAITVVISKIIIVLVELYVLIHRFSELILIRLIHLFKLTVCPFEILYFLILHFYLFGLRYYVVKVLFPSTQFL